MKNRLKLSVLFLLLMLTACAAAPSTGASSTPSELPAIPFDGNQLYAVAYLGYEEIGDLAYFKENGFIAGTPPIHYVSGGEYYLVIPRYPDMTLQLYRRRLDHDMGVLDLFYEEENAKPFILCCNVSDIFPDVTVLLTRGDDSAEFTPYLSLKDGSIQVGERGLDVTRLP